MIKAMNKVSRAKVLNLLSNQRHKETYEAIKGYKDIPYYDDANAPAIWHNEYSTKESLRINKQGLHELKTCFKLYPIPLKNGFQVKNLHVKYLERDMLFPWYLDNKKLVLFSQRDAMELKLQDGDLDAWARSRWVNESYQEPPALPDENQ
jgi:predicted molibdopterin-dependent oxidoreductase YjgC